MGKSEKKNNWKEFDKQNLGFVSNMEKNEDGQIVVHKFANLNRDLHFASKNHCSGLKQSGPSHGQRLQRAPFEALGVNRLRGSEADALNASNGLVDPVNGSFVVRDYGCVDGRVDSVIGHADGRVNRVNGFVNGCVDSVIGRVDLVNGLVNGRVVGRVDLVNIRVDGRADGCVPDASNRPDALPRGQRMDSQPVAAVAHPRVPDASKRGSELLCVPVASSKSEKAGGQLLRDQLAGASADASTISASAQCSDRNVHSRKRVVDSDLDVSARFHEIEFVSTSLTDSESVDSQFTPDVEISENVICKNSGLQMHDVPHSEQNVLDKAKSGENIYIRGNSELVYQGNLAENDTPTGNGNLVSNKDNKKLGKATMEKSWKSIFSENRKINSGISLQKFDSSLNFVELKEEDFEHNINYEWNHYFVGYFSGKFPGFIALKNLVSLTLKVNVSIYRHDSGWIIFKFNCKEDMDAVIQNVPYAIYGRSLILKIMPKYFSFDPSELSCFPVWLQVKNVSLCAWSPIPLGKILSFIGIPLCTDKVTATRERVSFVRALVEADMAHELPSKVDVMLPDNRMHSFPIVYENLPLFCRHCNRIGHVIANCVKMPKQAIGIKDGHKDAVRTSKRQDTNCSQQGLNCETVFEAYSSSKRTECGNMVAGNSGVQEPSYVQKNPACSGHLFDGKQVNLNFKEGLIDPSLHSKNPIMYGNNEQLVSSNSSQEGAVRKCQKSEFELKSREQVKVNDDFESSFKERFMLLIDRVNSRGMMENWLNYMEECMESHDSG